MKIVAIGTRGFPNVQGGIENHCEHLYTHMVKHGCDVTVFTRKPYVASNMYTYKGVSLIPVNCPRSKYLETVIHTFRSLIKAHKLKPDILHIHSIGASFFTPLARALGMKVVVTHHGPDYKREKWPLFAKISLRFCEWLGMTFANEVITITNIFLNDIKRKFERNATVIPNGVEIFPKADTEGILKKFGLQKKRYILAVGRFVPEKGLDDLIEAFNTGDFKNWKLVIVGDADHEDRYSKNLRNKASKNSNVILAGFLTGQPLQELYSHAGLFVLPSYYEGLPIVLLEAMSYGLSCIASDILGNKSVGLSDDRYFKVRDVKSLAAKIQEFINKPLGEAEKKKQINMLAEKYNWEKIADETRAVYISLIPKHRLVPVTSSLQPETKLKIAVLGTRGFPNIQGGVEVHCQSLYPQMVRRGCEVVVFTRMPYINPALNSFQGVDLISLSCPRSKYLETVIHTFKGIWAAKKVRPDILHVHAIGPSLFTPLARVLGMKVVVTHHGENYRHMKWGFFSKQALRFCEAMGMIFSNAIIAISGEIANGIRKKFHRSSVVIPNGVFLSASSLNNEEEELTKLGLKKGNYILSVGRFVPEKGLDVLISAFNGGNNQNWKLVIVGSADHEDRYSKNLRNKASKNSNVILTGFLTGQPLQELYSHAGLFVLPSYYEGLPIVLLEAMSYGLSCIASDILGNKSVGLSDDRYFKVRDVKSLAAKIQEFINKPLGEAEREKQINMLAENYNWEKIADETLKVYEHGNS